jgi:threonine dehydratase
MSNYSTLILIRLHHTVMAGQGTIGLEIVEQCEGADVVVVPVGGGGLIAGIATAIKTLSPNTKIIVSDQ